MPRVVPSQVVDLIDQRYPTAKSTPDFPVYSGDAAVLSAIVCLTREIPPELLTISGADYIDLIHGLEALQNSVNFWQLRGGDEPPKRIKEKSPVAVVRGALTKCPDENPSPATAELAFITDGALRDSIRNDISMATSSLHNGEWKGATVLAGAAAEALLLWKIQSDPKQAYKTLPNKPSGQPENWVLGQFIDVAEQLGFIKAATAAQARLAKDFRNLIHPGKAQRTGQACTLGTAYTALAAVDHIVRDIG
jgi:hypothetical protein